MGRWFGTREERCRGAAMVDMALALPPMTLILFATIEFGHAFVIREELVSAAAEAARVGSAYSCPRPTEDEVMAAAYATMESAGLDTTQADIELSNAGGESGSNYTVDLTYPVEFPVLSNLTSLPAAMELTVHVEAENE